MTPDPHLLHSVESVGDGDTITVLFALGADVFRRARLRLVLIDTPERGDAGAVEARRYTVAWLAAHPVLIVALQLTATGRYVETFGRYLADVYDPGTGDSLSGALLRDGHATLWT